MGSFFVGAGCARKFAAIETLTRDDALPKQFCFMDRGRAGRTAATGADLRHLAPRRNRGRKTA
ncbi:MAG: hypothetical protein BGO06_11235 [Shinella sp. 65-6]|nr:MAG: hypothetical protein BGO06_11235 [Shinella sp. 65-6]